MKKFVTAVGLFAAAIAISAPAVFAEDHKAKVIDTEIVFVPGRACNELPADIQGRSMNCEQVSFGKRQFAKVTVGYAPLEKQAMETEDLAYQHGG